MKLKTEMREWISYVALWEVQSIEDMSECRRIVPALHTGAYRDVTAEQMFAALQELRTDPKWVAHEAQCRSVFEAQCGDRSRRVSQQSSGDETCDRSSPSL